MRTIERTSLPWEGKRSRLTMEFSPAVDEDINELAKELHVSTKADVIRKALNLLKYVMQEQKAGGKLFVENEKQHVRKALVTL